MTTLIQVAKLYYLDNLSQQEIAKRLDVSRSLISHYLQGARAQGLVRIEIIDPLDRCEEISAAIKKKGGLKYVDVVPQAHNSSELTLTAVATRAARYLEAQLESVDVMGLAWGRSVNEMVRFFTPEQHRRFHDIDVAPLLGENSNLGQYTQLNQLVLQIAEAIGGRPNFLLVPMVVGASRLRDALLQEEQVQRIGELWNRLDVACIGIGVVPPTLGMIPYIGEEYIPRLVKSGAVGDLCGHYFDCKGQILLSGLEDRIIGVSVDQLRNARLVIAIAHGTEKAKAVTCALRTGLISGLFVDMACAELILELL